MLEGTVPELPSTKPRYLMGVGMPENLIEAVTRGIDLFDCVVPSRHGRTGWLFTSFGRVSSSRHAIFVMSKRSIRLAVVRSVRAILGPICTIFTM